MGNFYEDQSIQTIERATLAEDIKLPDLSKGANAFDVYKDETGKFNVNIMTPLVDNGDEASTKNNASPSTRNQKGSTLKTKAYKSSNYIQLTIPRYILFQFKGKVPKGTEFLIASVGGSVSIGDMQIIGLYYK